MSLDKKLSVLAGSLLASGLIASAQQTNGLASGWIYNPTTKHEYALTIQTNWLGARDIAKSVGGDLVTINDAEENQWLVDNFRPSGVDAFAIGLTNAVSTWKWSDGELLDFQNWNPGEPNNTGSYSLMYSFGNFWNFTPGKWDDYYGDASSSVNTPMLGIVERIPIIPYPIIKSINKTNDSISLKIETTPKFPYILETSQDLTNWQNVFTFPGRADTNFTDIFLPAQIEDRKFYRAKKAE